MDQLGKANRYEKTTHKKIEHINVFISVLEKTHKKSELTFF